MVKITIPKVKRKRSSEDENQEQKKTRQEPANEPEAVDPVDVIDVSSSDDDGGVEIISVQQQPQPSSFRKTQCPVCLEIPDVLVSTECGHLYCYDCVFAALCSTQRATRTFGECSICRRKVSYDKVMYLQMRKRPTEQAV